LTGLDADEHHVETVRKTVLDFLLTLLLAFVDPVFRQHVACKAWKKDVHHGLLGRGLAPCLEENEVDDAQHKKTDPECKLCEVEKPHGIPTAIASLQEGQANLAELLFVLWLEKGGVSVEFLIPVAGPQPRLVGLFDVLAGGLLFELVKGILRPVQQQGERNQNQHHT